MPRNSERVSRSASCSPFRVPSRAVNQTVLPRSTVLSTPIVPPMAAVRRWEMASPRPVPPVRAPDNPPVRHRRRKPLQGGADLRLGEPDASGDVDAAECRVHQRWAMFGSRGLTASILLPR